MRGVRTGIGQSPQVRGSATVGAWTLVSRITGAGRVIVIGAVLGPTYFANTFVATNSVPNLIYISILGSVLGPVVVPAIVRTTTEAGTRGATELLGRLAGFLLLVMGLASVALLVCSPLIARLLTVGIAGDSARQRGEYIALVMLAVCGTTGAPLYHRGSRRSCSTGQGSLRAGRGRAGSGEHRCDGDRRGRRHAVPTRG